MTNDKINATAVILAGGQSRRMKQDKQQLMIQNQWLMETLIEQLSSLFDEILIVSNKPSLYTNLQVKVIQDEVSIRGLGPLAGIYTSLKQAKHHSIFVTACDMPLLNKEAMIKQYEQLTSTHTQGCLLKSTDQSIDLYPFHAFYCKSILPLLEETLQQKNLKLRRFIKQLSLSFVDLDQLTTLHSLEDLMVNLNTPQDLLNYEKTLERKF